jgi:hypothetical protein
VIALRVNEVILEMEDVLRRILTDMACQYEDGRIRYDERVPLETRREILSDFQRSHDFGRSELKDKAAKLFGELNGWKVTGTGFTAKRLSKAHGDDEAHGMPSGLHDHCIYYRSSVKPFSNAAIVTQPYGDVDRERAIFDWAAKNGLALHVAPVRKASIHFPGACLFIVLTLPGVDVKWLPEQVNDDRLGEFFSVQHQLAAADMERARERVMSKAAWKPPRVSGRPAPKEADRRRPA